MKKLASFLVVSSLVLLIGVTGKVFFFHDPEQV